MTQYLTINAAAKEFGLPAFALRSMQKRGECPGFFSGSRFYVNCDMLAEKLDAECRSSMGITEKAAVGS